MKRSAAGLVLALAAVQLAPPSGTIAGFVIKAGTAIQQPLRDARLELSGGRVAQLVARTDSSGRFGFTNLAPGEYRLAVTSDGFIRREFPRKIVLGRGQLVSNILFELDPAPTAAGWVLDSYGEPAANIMVEALRRSYDVRGNPRLVRVASGLTDDRGEYRIFWLDPGEYFFLAASALPDGGETQPVRVFPPTYFPGVSLPEDAKPLRLDAGREVRVDFRLSPRVALWKVTGQTMNGMTSRSIAASITLTPPAEDPTFSRYRGQSSATGRQPGQFYIYNVAPGSYILTARSGSGDQEIAAFRRIVLRPVPDGPVAPPEYTVNLRLNPPLSVNGRMFVESRETVDLREARVGLTSVDPDLPSPRSLFAQPDGQFTLRGVVPGSYVLDIANLPRDMYLEAARFGDDDVLEKPLTLDTRDAPIPLQILLRSGGGRLAASAYNVNGELHPGAQFVLVPDAGRRYRRDRFRVAASGEDGQAILRGIPPGSYKLFAWENLEPNAYLNPDYLQAFEGFGVPVNIVSGDNPAISVRLIPKD